MIRKICRIPNTSLPASVERYDNTISKLTSHSSYDIIVGTDSNLDLLKIQEHKPTSDFFDNCVSSGLIPVITKPTRITHNTATLIDNLYINLQDNHIHSGIITTKLSDHLPIFAFYGKSLKYKPEPVRYQTRDLGDSNLLQLKQKLERYDWTFLHNLDSNAAYDKFLELLTAELNSAAPLKRINILPTNVIREPWLTKGIIKSSKTLDKLYNKTLNKQKDHITHQEFRSYRNQYNRIKKKMKQDYYHNLFQKYKKDIRKTWEVMRTIIKKTNDKSKISDTFMLGDTKLDDPNEIASAFCDYFTNIGHELSNKIPIPNKRFDQYMNVPPTENSMFMRPTDLNEISAIIKKLKPKKSTGSDNISSWLIHKLNDYISSPLAILVNKSITDGVFPDKLKIAKIIPIYKAKDKKQFSNYRPISLLSSISKIYEKIIYKRLYFFIEQYLYNKQFGFRTKHSTIQAVLEFCADTIDSLENKNVTMATFLDLSKAFDTIDHNILLRKLEMYGIRGVALKWFESYLSGRKHFIQYKSTLSMCQSMLCGVPQGSVLGPLLFIIYTNDLPKCLKNANCILFADDTTIYDTSNDINRLYVSINENLNSLADWFKANKLSLNINKTNYMLFGKSSIQNESARVSLCIGKDVIKQVKSTKFLGLIIDDQLKWSDHISHVKSKLTSSLFAIRKAKHVLSQKHIKTLYYSMFHPYLEYGNIIWGSAAQSLLKPIEILQKKAVRIINNSNYNTHTGPIFKSHNILSLHDLHSLQVNKFMYQYHHNSLPTPLMDLFTPNRIIHHHNTRHRDSPHIVYRRTAKASQSIVHKGPKFWQSVPQNVKDAKTLYSFSQRFKKSITQTY